MPKPPDDTPKPGRIILPGDVSATPRAPLVTASGAAASSDDAPAPSRIVLPPGTAIETDEELPEFPRLRMLNVVPVRDGERELLVISDPLGVIPQPVALSLEALPLLQMLDGRTSLTDLSAALVRGSKDIRAGSWVKEFIAQLDKMLVLEGPRFEAEYEAIRTAYHQLEVRQAALWGVTYPEEPAEVATLLDSHVAAAEELRREAQQPIAAADATPRLLMAPHLDPRRSGPTLARSYLELGNQPKEPLRVVVFGVGHMLWGDLFAFTRKGFETPFGKVACDTVFVDRVAEVLGPDAYHGEIAHRDEHSIEFQALYLKHRLGDRPFSMVPVLAGGFLSLLELGKRPRDIPMLESLITAVREAERSLGGTTVYLAGIDLSHVGTRFGDPAPDERTLRETEASDRAALDAAVRGDADGWFDAIAAIEDRTRICGWAATYLALRCAEPGPGRLLRYEQSNEEGGSMVSIGSAVWP